MDMCTVASNIFINIIAITITITECCSSFYFFYECVYVHTCVWRSHIQKGVLQCALLHIELGGTLHVIAEKGTRDGGWGWGMGMGDGDGGWGLNVYGKGYGR